MFTSTIGTTLETFILITALAYATFTDTQTMEIPIFVFPVSCIAIALCKLFSYGISDFPLSDVLLGMAVLAVPFIIGAFFNACGGGDILMFAAIGFTIGFSYVIYYAVAMVASGIIVGLFYCVRHLFKTHSLHGTFKMHIPLAPIALIAFILFVFGGYYYVYK